jgi:hypothetical protein
MIQDGRGLRGFDAPHNETSGDLSSCICQNVHVRNLTKEASSMSIQSHLAELERKHEALETELADALAHPSVDDTTIVELKRRKLHVKDEIARLKHTESASVH